MALPESLLTEYIHTMGFAHLTVDEGTVAAVAINQEAYDAYQADHKETPPTAERDYEPGEYLTMDGTLYRVLLPIFAGAKITVVTNVEATTLGAEITRLKEEETI